MRKLLAKLLGIKPEVIIIDNTNLLEIKPYDVIKLKTDNYISKERMLTIADSLSKTFPENKIIIIGPDDVSLEINLK